MSSDAETGSRILPTDIHTKNSLQPMLLRFVMRGYLRRWFISGLAVLALGIALATSLASWRMGATLSTGQPRGTSFSTRPVSLFQYSSDSRLHFFLSPRQIAYLESDFGGSARVIGASGVRRLDWDDAGTTRSLQADFVSANFFSTLGVGFSEGSAEQFAATEDGVVLSDAFIREHRLETVPADIRISGRRMPVVGVARDFSGLFDHQTQAWVHWAQAEGILYPHPKGGKQASFDDQMWFFWALAVPLSNEQNRFQTLLSALADRGAQIAPPFDRLVAIPGITNQTDLHAQADQSQRLYGLVSMLLLCIAFLSMGLLVTLIRLSRLSSEWTMLRLGAPRYCLLLLPIIYGLIPIAVSALIAVLLVPWLQRLLLLDPSIASLMAASADLLWPSLWREFALTLAVGGVVCTLFNALVMRGAGVHFAATQLRTQSRKLDRLFHCFSGIIAAAAMLTLLVSVLAAGDSMMKSRAIAAASVRDVWFQQIGSAKEAASLSSAQRRQLQVQLAAQIPNAQHTGFVTLRPLSGAKVALSEYSLVQGQVRLMVNAATPDAVAALGLTLKAGRLFAAESSNELVLDEDAAKQIQALIAPRSVLGAQLQDDIGDSATVVGIVANVPYTTDLGQAPALAYQAMPSGQESMTLVIRGPLNEQDLRRLKTRGPAEAFKLKYAEPLAFTVIANTLRRQHQARATLTIITAISALVVVVFVLACASLLRARRRSHDYAVRMALGAPGHRIIGHFLRAELISNAVGAIAGVGLIVLLRIPDRLTLTADTHTQIWTGSMIMLLFLATSLIVLLLAIRPSLSSRSLLTHLQRGGD